MNKIKSMDCSDLCNGGSSNTKIGTNRDNTLVNKIRSIKAKLQALEIALLEISTELASIGRKNSNMMKDFQRE